MIYGYLASLLALFLILLGLTFLFWKLWTKEQERHREERITWERERERLLNRAMTKEWTSYAQMQAALVPNSVLDSNDVPGMSDEEELRRFGQQVNEAQGIGETLVELDDHDREFFEPFTSGD